MTVNLTDVTLYPSTTHLQAPTAVPPARTEPWA